MSAKGNDFQNQSYIFIINRKDQLPHPRGTNITDKNLREIAIYFAVRHVIEATWINDRDQFLFPNDGWKEDIEFQNDCLVFTLFNNNIKSEEGINHWIPYKEDEVNAKDRYKSHFMINYINGSFPKGELSNLSDKGDSRRPLEFSVEAMEVLNAGKELYRYYHSMGNSDPNASFYDIRKYFQGINEKGKMNNSSEDKQYMDLLRDLRDKLKVLAEKIEPLVYEYGFLRK
ncbi:MAG: hypothetical protein J1F16_01935 [Muribaculaceae bacterium]|nr:hypothetical protein [Muribaculaceae bacterium]